MFSIATMRNTGPTLFTSGNKREDDIFHAVPNLKPTEVNTGHCTECTALQNMPIMEKASQG